MPPRQLVTMQLMPLSGPRTGHSMVSSTDSMVSGPRGLRQGRLGMAQQDRLVGQGQEARSDLNDRLLL